MPDEQADGGFSLVRGWVAPECEFIMSTDPNLPRESANVCCVHCGYDLTGVALGTTCPECGTPVNSSYQRAINAQATSGHAIASLVLGIVAIPTCMCYGLPALICGALAIYFYRVWEQRARYENFSPGSHGMAKAGMICGIVGLCLGGLYLLFIVVWIGMLVATDGSGF